MGWVQFVGVESAGCVGLAVRGLGLWAGDGVSLSEVAALVAILSPVLLGVLAIIRRLDRLHLLFTHHVRSGEKEKMAFDLWRVEVDRDRRSWRVLLREYLKRKERNEHAN
jgi:hypothetical protein